MASAKELKQKIKDGEVVVALRPDIKITKANFEKALTKGSYDLVYIDGQHTPFSDDQLVAISGIAEQAGLPVQFRIPHTRNTYLIGRYLDMGLSGILVPEVACVQPSIPQHLRGQLGIVQVALHHGGAGNRDLPYSRVVGIDDADGDVRK